MHIVPPLLTKGERKTRHRVIFCAALLLAASSLAWTLHAKQPSPQDSFDDAITVREATIYVRVKGPRGPITDIDRDHFNVTLLDEELSIVSFQEMVAYDKKRERRQQEADQTGTRLVPDEPAVLPRNILLAFDVLFTERNYLQEGVKGMRRVLDQLGPRDRIAVVRLGTRADLITPFTEDREQINAALDYVEAGFNADRDGLQRASRRLQTKSEMPSGYFGNGFGLRAELTRSPAGLLSLAPTIQSRFTTVDTADSLALIGIAEQGAITSTVQAANQAFSDLARALSDVEGPRIAMFLGRGMPGFVDVLEYSKQADMKSPMLNSYQRMIYQLAANGWVVDAFDVTGLGGRSTTFSMANNAPRAELSSEQLSAPPSWVRRGSMAGNDSDSLFFVAEGTGGTLYDNFNRLSVAFEKSLESSNHAYRLIVQLPDSAKLLARQGGSQVKVQVVGVPVRAKVTSSYAADWSLPAHLRSSKPEDRVRADLLSSGTAKKLSPLQAHVSVFREPIRNIKAKDDRARGHHRAVVVVEVEKSMFSELAGSRAGGLKLHAISVPRSATGSEATFYDLWLTEENWTFRASDPDQVVAIGDLLIPCEGGRIVVRLSGTDDDESWVATRTLADACDNSNEWATPISAPGASTLSIEPSLVFSANTTIPFLRTGSSLVPKIRATVVQGQALEFLVRRPSSAAADNNKVPFVLHPIGDGEPLRRLANIVQSGTSTETTVTAQLDFDVPTGHYRVILEGGLGSESGAVVSVF